jgi:hypothetical protein
VVRGRVRVSGRAGVGSGGTLPGVSTPSVAGMDFGRARLRGCGVQDCSPESSPSRIGTESILGRGDTDGVVAARAMSPGSASCWRVIATGGTTLPCGMIPVCGTGGTPFQPPGCACRGRWCIIPHGARCFLFFDNPAVRTRRGIMGKCPAAKRSHRILCNTLALKGLGRTSSRKTNPPRPGGAAGSGSRSRMTVVLAPSSPEDAPWLVPRAGARKTSFTIAAIFYASP